MTKRYHFILKQLIMFQTLHIFLTIHYKNRKNNIKNNIKNDWKFIKLEAVKKE